VQSSTLVGIPRGLKIRYLDRLGRIYLVIHGLQATHIRRPQRTDLYRAWIPSRPIRCYPATTLADVKGKVLMGHDRRVHDASQGLPVMRNLDKMKKKSTARSPCLVTATTACSTQLVGVMVPTSKIPTRPGRPSCTPSSTGRYMRKLKSESTPWARVLERRTLGAKRRRAAAKSATIRSGCTCRVHVTISMKKGRLWRPGNGIG